MSYTHGLRDIPMTVGTATLDLTTTGDKARWSPGMHPKIVRGATIHLNAAPGDAGVVKFDKRPTYGSDTGRGDGDVGIINLATSHAAGDVVYKLFTPVKIDADEEVVVEVTDASAAVNAAKITLLVEDTWEEPTNNTVLKKST